MESHIKICDVLLDSNGNQKKHGEETLFGELQLDCHESFSLWSLLQFLGLPWPREKNVSDCKHFILRIFYENKVVFSLVVFVHATIYIWSTWLLYNEREKNYKTRLSDIRMDRQMDRQIDEYTSVAEQKKPCMVCIWHSQWYGSFKEQQQ